MSFALQQQLAATCRADTRATLIAYTRLLIGPAVQLSGTAAMTTNPPIRRRSSPPSLICRSSPPSFPDGYCSPSSAHEFRPPTVRHWMSQPVNLALLASEPLLIDIVCQGGDENGRLVSLERLGRYVECCPLVLLSAPHPRALASSTSSEPSCFQRRYDWTPDIFSLPGRLQTLPKSWAFSVLSSEDLMETRSAEMSWEARGRWGGRFRCIPLLSTALLHGRCRGYCRVRWSPR